MVGKKSTEYPLTPLRMRSSMVTDITKSSNTYRILAIGVGETGSRTATELQKINSTRIQTAVSNQTIDRIEAILEGKKAVFIIAKLCGTVLKRLHNLADHAKKHGARIIGVYLISQQAKNDNVKLIYDSQKLLYQKHETVFLIDTDKLKELTDEISCASALEKVIAYTVNTIIESTLPLNLVNIDSTQTSGVIRGEGFTDLRFGDFSPREYPQEGDQKVQGSQTSFDNKNLKIMLNLTRGNQLIREDVDYYESLIKGSIDDVHLIYGTEVKQAPGGKIVVTLKITGVDQLAAPRGLAETPLFNLEPYSKSKSRLSIDFGLYQLEKF